MSHLDDDALVDLALRDDAVLSGHVRDCVRCRNALEGLSRATRALRGAEIDGLVPAPPAIREAVSPPPRVWEAIESAVGVDATEESGASTGPASTGPASTGPASTGPASTGPASTGPASTGPASTGPASTGPASTGPASTGEERGFPEFSEQPKSSGPAEQPTPSAGHSAARESRVDRSRRGRGRHAGGRSTTWLVAAVAGLILGAVGGYVVRAPEQTPAAVSVAEVELTASDADAGPGRAALVRTDDGLDLRVRTDRLDAGAGYLEVWLINSDLERMVSVGVLPEDAGRRSFPISQRLIDEGYVIVDISREPFDDEPRHSDDTVLRGALDA